MNIIIFSKLLNVSLRQSAVILCSSFIVLIAFIIKQTLSKFLKNKYSNSFLMLSTICLMLMSAIYFPFFNKNIYLGQGSPNVWHNPTLLMVKPFAFTSFLLFLKFIESKQCRSSIGSGILLALSLCISVYIKPNFAVSFIPAITFYVFIKHLKEIKIYLKACLPVLPTLILLFFQFLSAQSQIENKIALDFFKVWHLYTPNVIISLILALAFPLFVAIFRFKRLQNNNYLVLTWILTFVTIIQAGFLAEDGPRYIHFNWFWGYLISLQILFIFTTIDFLEWLKSWNLKNNLEKIKVSLSGSLFFLHVSSGIFYFLKILSGKSYA